MAKFTEKHLRNQWGLLTAIDKTDDERLECFFSLIAAEIDLTAILIWLLTKH